MATTREQILKAVMARLNADDKPADVPATERVLSKATDAQSLPLIVLYPVKEDVERKGPIAKRTFVFRVDCRAVAEVDSETAVDEACDSMLDWVTCALAGQRLGGLVNDISETAVEWSIEAADYAYCSATVDFIVSYQTDLNNQRRYT